MPLLGRAALLLAFDVAEDAIAEHDDWHTHEHLPERLSIPGFRRGTRWVAAQGHPRYFVVYEVADLDVLTSAPYRERLDHPTPWTSRMMPHYRGMARGLCSVTGSFGLGAGTSALVVRIRPGSGRESALRDRLLADVLPALPARRGIGSAHLFESAAAAPMTAEQRIRGVDASFDWAVLVTGYEQDAVAALRGDALGEGVFAAHGAVSSGSAVYRQAYTLTDRETRE
jgi:hypothetical protein